MSPIRSAAVALGAIACVWLIAATVRPALAEPLYPQPFFEVGDKAFGVAAGDFNADGIPDAVVGARRGFAGCAAVLLGGARSVLRDAGCLPLGGDPVAFAVADFDGDGHLDLAAGWESLYYPISAGIGIYLGNGDGTFRAGAQITTELVRSLVTGDFDGDGIPDLAVGILAIGGGAAYAAVLRGRGDGSFGPLEQFTDGLVVLVAADFDEDGLSDLATADGSQSLVTIYLGSASGTLAPRISYDVGQGPGSLAAADFDGDGHIDLAVGFVQDQQVRILIGRGNGQFSAQPPVALGEGAGPMTDGDFDGDGHPDVAVTRLVGQGIIMLASDGHGGLRQTAVLDAAAGALAVADYDGDGLPDLAATSGTGVAILRALGDFSVPANITVSSGPVLRDATAGDFNHDGRDDLAVSSDYTQEIYVYFGRSDGAFNNPIELPAGTPPELLRVGDFNGDGNLDLASIGGPVVIFLGDGRGGFAPPRTTYVPVFGIQNGAVGDVNGDGRDDVVVVGQVNPYAVTGYAVVLLAGPDGTLQQGLYSEAGHRPRSVAIGDLDGDGRADLAVVNREIVGGYYYGALTIVPGLGDGTFGQPRTSPLDGSAEGIAAADLDDDGILDLVIAETGTTDIGTGALAVLIGTGGGAFAPERHYAATQGPLLPIVHDVDGDGVLDLVTVGEAGGDVAVLRGDGLGAFAPQEDYATYASFQSLSVGDFNGDGRADLALTNHNTNFTDGLVVVVPGRPPFPCLPSPTDEPGHCSQDVTAARLLLGTAIGRGAGVVAWRTTHEYDVTGFNVVEMDQSGTLIRLNNTQIPCTECSGGMAGSYVFPVPHYSGRRNIYIQLFRLGGPPRLYGPAVRG